MHIMEGGLDLHNLESNSIGWQHKRDRFLALSLHVSVENTY